MVGGWGPTAALGSLSHSRVGSKCKGETIAIVNYNASMIRDNIMSLERPQMVFQQRETHTHTHTQECINQPGLVDAIDEFNF